MSPVRASSNAAFRCSIAVGADGHAKKSLAGVYLVPKKSGKSSTTQKDACYKKVKASYEVFPSARASQAIAKCRKKTGDVRATKKGSDLKRWQSEKWVDTRTGKPCGDGGKNEYCRPTKRVSKATPKTKSEMSSGELAKKKSEKSKVGMGRRVSAATRRNKKQ